MIFRFVFFVGLLCEDVMGCLSMPDQKECIFIELLTTFDILLHKLIYDKHQDYTKIMY